jgi:hypothetical protein
MAGGGFLFVDVDNPTERRSKANKPASQRYSKEARKHVMRDIGLSRRKDKPAKAPKSRSTNQELNLVDGPAKRPSASHEDTNGDEENAAMLLVNGAQSEESLSPFVLQAAEEDMEDLLPILARNVGGYRQDPFVKYPIELDHRARQLLDTREFVRPQRAAMTLLEYLSSDPADKRQFSILESKVCAPLESLGVCAQRWF